MAKCLMDFIYKHGVPDRIIHDRAAEFFSEVMQETARLIGVTQLPTSGGHPQIDGLVERLNRTLKQMMSKLVSKGGRNWDTLLGPVLFAYRTTPIYIIGCSPHFILYMVGMHVYLHHCHSVLPTVRYPTLETEYGRALV